MGQDGSLSSAPSSNFGSVKRLLTHKYGWNMRAASLELELHGESAEASAHGGETEANVRNTLAGECIVVRKRLEDSKVDRTRHTARVSSRVTLGPGHGVHPGTDSGGEGSSQRRRDEGRLCQLRALTDTAKWRHVPTGRSSLACIPAGTGARQ